MSAAPATTAHAAKRQPSRVQRGTRWVRYTLTAVALGFMFLFLVLPLAVVFTEGLRKGLGVYVEALNEPDALLTLSFPVTTSISTSPPAPTGC